MQTFTKKTGEKSSFVSKATPNAADLCRCWRKSCKRGLLSKWAGSLGFSATSQGSTRHQMPPRPQSFGKLFSECAGRRSGPGPGNSQWTQRFSQEKLLGPVFSWKKSPDFKSWENFGRRHGELFRSQEKNKAQSRFCRFLLRLFSHLQFIMISFHFTFTSQYTCISLSFNFLKKNSSPGRDVCVIFFRS